MEIGNNMLPQNNQTYSWKFGFELHFSFGMSVSLASSTRLWMRSLSPGRDSKLETNLKKSNCPTYKRWFRRPVAGCCSSASGTCPSPGRAPRIAIWSARAESWAPVTSSPSSSPSSGCFATAGWCNTPSVDARATDCRESIA